MKRRIAFGICAFVVCGYVGSAVAADRSVERPNIILCMTDNQYKLVKPAPDKWELYDLIADRAETTNIADKQPEVVERMKAELEAWQLSVIHSWHGNDYPEGKVIQPEKPKTP